MKFTIDGDTYETKLVHQGGHHEIYCNGKVHIKTTGGKCWPNMKRTPEEIYECDCEWWKSHSEDLTK